MISFEWMPGLAITCVCCIRVLHTEPAEMVQQTKSVAGLLCGLHAAHCRTGVHRHILVQLCVPYIYYRHPRVDDSQGALIFAGGAGREGPAIEAALAVRQRPSSAQIPSS